MKSGARGRTMAHMHRMLAATAAVGCSRADVQSVTLTPLPTVPASTTDTAPAPLPPVASATFSAQPPPAPPPDPSGYLVVDMLPAPARCLGLANAASSSARMIAGASGSELEIVVTLPSHGRLAGSKFNGNASPWAGQVVRSTFTRGGTVATVRMKAATGVTTLGVSLGVTCGSAGTGSLVATATLANAKVALTDY
ncbi:MAG TPA: hypothetical protein VGH28_20670 [Polyangiaceae bacterium]|jgi:hypothetical protein